MSTLITKMADDINQVEIYNSPNRRKRERIQTPFQAIVRGVDINNEPFEVSTVIDNFSVSGLYLRLVQPVVVGTKMIVTARLTTSPVEKCCGPVVLLRSKVLRVEPKPGGVNGLALAIMHRRFL